MSTGEVGDQLSGRLIDAVRCPACGRALRLEPAPPETVSDLWERRSSRRRVLRHSSQDRRFYCDHCNAWLAVPV